MFWIILECVYTALALCGCYLVMKKKSLGWLFWLISTPAIIAVLIKRGSYPVVLVFIAYGVLDYIGWRDWRKEEKQK